jgi:3-deoxy-7-phosphoheptulonate synthase
MVVVMEKGASKEAMKRVIDEVKQLGFTPHVSEGEMRTLIGAIGPVATPEVREQLRAFRGVEAVVPITRPFKLASREFRPDDSKVTIGGVETGNGHFTVAAGPCGVESLVGPLALAIVEVHPEPEKALSDAAQQLTDDEFGALMTTLRQVVAALGKSL